MRKLAALLVGRNIAQMVERLTFNQRVTGSSPVVPVAFIALFFDKEDTSNISSFFVSGWLAVTVMMFVSSLLVLKVLMKLVETYNSYKKRH